MHSLDEFLPVWARLLHWRDWLWIASTLFYSWRWLFNHIAKRQVNLFVIESTFFNVGLTLLPTSLHLWLFSPSIWSKHYSFFYREALDFIEKHSTDCPMCERCRYNVENGVTNNFCILSYQQEPIQLGSRPVLPCSGLLKPKWLWDGTCCENEPKLIWKKQRQEQVACLCGTKRYVSHNPLLIIL